MEGEVDEELVLGAVGFFLVGEQGFQDASFGGLGEKLGLEMVGGLEFGFDGADLLVGGSGEVGPVGEVGGGEE